jgi:hypothetical protein
MKMKLYEPHDVGYVSLNPYEWEYSGRYPEIEALLESHPVFYEGIVTEDGEGEREITDDKKYLSRLKKELKHRKLWHVELIEDG